MNTIFGRGHVLNIMHSRSASASLSSTCETVINLNAKSYWEGTPINWNLDLYFGGRMFVSQHLENDLRSRKSWGDKISFSSIILSVRYYTELKAQKYPPHSKWYSKKFRNHAFLNFIQLSIYCIKYLICHFTEISWKFKLTVFQWKIINCYNNLNSNF